MITEVLNKKNIVIFLVLIITIFSYIVYLNLNIIDLNKKIEMKNTLYNIQINNRINEIEQLNSQLNDLHQLLNIGLDLSNSSNVYLDTQLNKGEKEFILDSIPSASPLKNIFITSKFGFRFHPIFNRNKLHTGIDFRANIGTKIYSTADGIVSKARDIDEGGYGKMVRIVHNYGFETIYAHLEHTNVKEGDVIKKGSLIGLSGNTGNSSGPHLHYEVRYLNKYLDPLTFLYWNKKTFDTIFTKNQEKINWKDLVFLIKNHNN